MFVARAGLRQLRTGADGNHPFAYRPKKKKEKQKFRCYIPFMWSTCVAIFTGFAILSAGLLMCVFGYFGDDSHRQRVDNSTRSWNVTETSGINHMRGLTYIGPVLMGFGCFIIVVACVVVCETRDRMLKIIAQAEKQKKKVTTKPDFYDLVIKQFKDKHKATLRRSSKVKHDAGIDSETGNDGGRKCGLFHFRRPQSAKSSFSHIGGALKTIPVQIFTIDVERNKQTSLQPVSSTLSHTLRVNSAGSNKYPSTSCIHDLLRDHQQKDAVVRKPLPARISWIKRPKTAFPDRRPMHRLKPLVPTDSLYHNHNAGLKHDAYQDDSLVRHPGNNQVSACSNLKDAGEIKGEFSSDSETDDRPEGCVCLCNSKDYTIVDTSTDASEDRSVSPTSSRSFPHCKDPNRRTLLLHQASVHGEDGTSSQDLTDADICSLSSSNHSLSTVSNDSLKRRDSLNSDCVSESSATSGHGSDYVRGTRRPLTPMMVPSMRVSNSSDQDCSSDLSAAGSATSLTSNCSTPSLKQPTEEQHAVRPVIIHTEITPLEQNSAPQSSQGEPNGIHKPRNITTTTIHVVTEGPKSKRLQNGDAVNRVAV